MYDKVFSYYTQVFSQSDLTLKDFDQIEDCEVASLKTIADCEKQMEFLEVLSNSQQFIAWLQEETKGDYTASYIIIIMKQ